MKGLSGDYQQAVVHAKKVLNPNEDISVFPMYWNDFILGNIAFWSRDKATLEIHIKNIKVGMSFKPNEINLNYLNRLLQHFDSSYLEAMSHKS